MIWTGDKHSCFIPRAIKFLRGSDFCNFSCFSTIRKNTIPTKIYTNITSSLVAATLKRLFHQIKNKTME